MKKILILIMMIIAAFLPAVSAAQPLELQYDGETHMYTGAQYALKVNGNAVEVPLAPIIFNDRALVPIREVFEALGATVDYNGVTKVINVSADSVSVKLQIGSNKAFINGNEVNIPDGVVPKLINKTGESAKTMVPVRFISESIGFNVDFDGTTGTISITSNLGNIGGQTENTIQTASAKITDIKTTETENGLRIKIESNSPISDYKAFTMNDPFKIVVDANNAVIETSKNSFDVNKYYVERVRLGQHETSARIVVDFKEKKEYSIAADNTGLVIDIISANEPGQDTVPTQTPSAPITADRKVVVIDAGHGNHDGGTHGTTSAGANYNEKDVALTIAQYTRDILQNNGVEVIMTRDNDTFLELTDRSAVANNAGAAMFVSIHLNSVDNAPSASGTEVYYAKSNDSEGYGLKSSQLAKNVHDSLIAVIGAKDRGVKTANHVVTRTSNMPAILVEVGFMSNTAEMDNLANPDYQYKAAQGIAQGIINSLPSVIMPSQQLSVNTAIEYMTD